MMLRKSWEKCHGKGQRKCQLHWMWIVPKQWPLLEVADDSHMFSLFSFQFSWPTFLFSLLLRVPQPRVRAAYVFTLLFAVQAQKKKKKFTVRQSEREKSKGESCGESELQRTLPAFIVFGCVKLFWRLVFNFFNRATDGALILFEYIKTLNVWKASCCLNIVVLPFVYKLMHLKRRV